MVFCSTDQRINFVVIKPYVLGEDPSQHGRAAGVLRRVGDEAAPSPAGDGAAEEVLDVGQAREDLAEDVVGDLAAGAYAWIGHRLVQGFGGCMDGSVDLVMEASVGSTTIHDRTPILSLQFLY